MGCLSSKLFRRNLKREILFVNGDYSNHIVSLTSSSYGALKLDKEQPPIKVLDKEQQPIKEVVIQYKKSSIREDTEIINTWELMEDLEDQAPISIQSKKSPKSRVFLHMDVKSPMKFFNQTNSPKKFKKFGGKENKGRANVLDYTPRRVLKSVNSTENSWKTAPTLRIPINGSPIGTKCDSSSRRRSLGPLFDPELVACFEKELSEEGEEIKKMVSGTPITRKSTNFLEGFAKKCPPGGENGVVIYTTTLRGIRKTFEACNTARSIMESHGVQTIERDVSMDSGFKEELRGLMGTKEVKVPLVFVRGRLIGGADEIVKLEEEGKLGILFDGIPRAGPAACEGCAGVRFVMCLDCSGSCKVLDGDGKKTVKCGECNENGLIQCPICC